MDLVNKFVLPVISYNNIKQIAVIKQIVTEVYHLLFLKEDGTVWGRGYNDSGQLGIGNYDNQTTLQQVKGLNGYSYITDIEQIAIGYNYSLFLKKDGTVFSCGNNGNGQLGINNYIYKNTLQQVKGLYGIGYITNIKQIATGFYHSLFLSNDGTVFSCGNNENGQLGCCNYVSNNNKKNTLQQVYGLNGYIYLTNIKQIATGEYHSLFLADDGTVYSCGSNDYGQLGIGHNNKKNFLQQVTSATNIKQISAGFYHSLFLKNDGTVFSCGRNFEGQLGIGDYQNKNTLQQVKGLNGNEYITDIKQIATGEYHSLFLKNDSTVFGCGRNFEGQLGIGNYDNQHTLQQVK
ncbi:MAG: hypothetical protein EBZ69_09715 [Alphaproteobacteria bacterium]|nr:hypothetical protein [Alphaproteobacteria bacterium]